jgi:hypothetical protein
MAHRTANGGGWAPRRPKSRYATSQIRRSLKANKRRRLAKLLAVPERMKKGHISFQLLQKALVRHFLAGEEAVVSSR